MNKKYYNVPPNSDMPFPFSHAVEAGEYVFLSGQPSMNLATGAFIEGDLEQQFEQCFSNLEAVLAEAGLTLNDVVKCTVFLIDMADFPLVNQLYSKKFSKPYPSRSCFAVKGLPMGACIEIEMIAYKKSGN